MFTPLAKLMFPGMVKLPSAPNSQFLLATNFPADNTIVPSAAASGLFNLTAFHPVVPIFVLPNHCRSAPPVFPDARTA